MTGDRPDLVVLPGWVSSLEVLASGRDPRSSLLDRLAGELALALPAIIVAAPGSPAAR